MAAVFAYELSYGGLNVIAMRPGSLVDAILSDHWKAVSDIKEIPSRKHIFTSSVTNILEDEFSLTATISRVFSVIGDSDTL